MKSRAPSGVDLMSSGVSTSTKPASWCSVADGLLRGGRGRGCAAGGARGAGPGSGTVRRTASSTSASGSLMTNGGVREGPRTLIRSARSSTSPVARRGFCVPGKRSATRAVDLEHELAAGARGDRMRLGRFGRIDDDLRHAVAVAQVDEDELAHVAAAVDPAGERHASARHPRGGRRRRSGPDTRWRSRLAHGSRARRSTAAPAGLGQRAREDAHEHEPDAGELEG